MKSGSKEIEEGRIRYAFSVARDAKGKPCLFSTKQIYSRKHVRYIDEVIDGKPTTEPVKLEEASELLASLIAEASW